MRYFTWGPQEWAENCSCSGEHYHVCISSPQGRDIRPRCNRKSLNLFFHDLDPEAIRRTEAYAKDAAYGEELIKHCFTEEQARAIVDYVKSTPENTVILVNCEAGISRSAGVVLAMRRFYGDSDLGTADEVFQRAHPNVHVTSVLSRILRE